jgi:hypothetical protein
MPSIDRRLRAAPLLVVLAGAALGLALAGCPPPCKSGLTLCQDQCVDLRSDVTFCGSCDSVPCSKGASCDAGVCACPPGQGVCGHACVDLSQSPDNCGTCGHACGAGTCQAGGCVCDATATRCPGTSPECANLQSDPSHCGGCSTVCPLGGEVCDAGQCACPPATPTACPGACASLSSDRQNCGGCGVVCPLSNQICQGSTCQCPAATPDACGTRCVSLDSDGANCGHCGTACAATQVCTHGQCVCSGTKTQCTTDGGVGCYDLTQDPAHCGRCDLTCPGGASCGASTCSCPSAQGGAICGQVAGKGGLCCAGDGCCGSGCQTQHDNGLGQHYFDCNAYGTHTAAEAIRAAEAWSDAGIFSPAPGCPLDCVCVPDSTGSSAVEAAVFCYDTSALTGYVGLTLNPSCYAAACPSPGTQTTTPWN